MTRPLGEWNDHQMLSMDPFPSKEESYLARACKIDNKSNARIFHVLPTIPHVVLQNFMTVFLYDATQIFDHEEKWSGWFQREKTGQCIRAATHQHVRPSQLRAAHAFFQCNLTRSLLIYNQILSTFAVGTSSALRPCIDGLRAQGL